MKTRAAIAIALACCCAAAAAPAAAEEAAADGALSTTQFSAPDTWVVQAGDSLWNIAARAFGDGYLWPALYLANRDQIKDPSLLYLGQRLSIPRLDAAEHPALRAEAKELLKPPAPDSPTDAAR